MGIKTKTKSSFTSSPPASTTRNGIHCRSHLAAHATYEPTSSPTIYSSTDPPTPRAQHASYPSPSSPPHRDEHCPGHHATTKISKKSTQRALLHWKYRDRKKKIEGKFGSAYPNMERLVAGIPNRQFRDHLRVVGDFGGWAHAWGADVSCAAALFWNVSGFLWL